METEKIITRFIVEELLNSQKEAPPLPDESLIESGILDSVSVLKLLLFIEEQFDINIPDREITPDNFETVSRIADFIKQKTNHMQAERQ